MTLNQGKEETQSLVRVLLLHSDNSLSSKQDTFVSSSGPQEFLLTWIPGNHMDDSRVMTTGTSSF